MEREFKFNNMFLTVFSGIIRSTSIENCQAWLNQLPADRLVNPCLAQRSKQIIVTLEFSICVGPLTSKFRHF